MACEWEIISERIKVMFSEKERKDFYQMISAYEFADKLSKKFKKKTVSLNREELDLISLCYKHACDNRADENIDFDMIEGFVCNQCWN